LQEHDAIAGGKAADATLDGDAYVIPQIARIAHARSRSFVERPHFGIDMG